MKVLHVETGRHLYGGALQVKFLLEGLAGRWPADEHLLACPVGAAIGRELLGRVPVIELSLGGDLDIGMVWRLRGLFGAGRPDLVHLRPAPSASRSCCRDASTTPSHASGWR
jgi:hypothetical protein